MYVSKRVSLVSYGSLVGDMISPHGTIEDGWVGGQKCHLGFLGPTCMMWIDVMVACNGQVVGAAEAVRCQGAVAAAAVDKEEASSGAAYICRVNDSLIF